MFEADALAQRAFFDRLGIFPSGTKKPRSGRRLPLLLRRPHLCLQNELTPLPEVIDVLCPGHRQDIEREAAAPYGGILPSVLPDGGRGAGKVAVVIGGVFAKGGAGQVSLVGIVLHPQAQTSVRGRRSDILPLLDTEELKFLSHIAE